MEVNAKTLIASHLCAAIAGACITYGLTPVKIKTEVKTVEIEKKIDEIDTKRDKRQKVVITEVEKPDGTKEKTTTISTDTQTDQKRTDQDQTAVTQVSSKTETRGGDKFTVTFLAGDNVGSPFSIVYGGAVTKPILGPITVGFWGLTDKTGGVSLGLTF